MRRSASPGCTGGRLLHRRRCAMPSGVSPEIERPGTAVGVGSCCSVCITRSIGDWFVRANWCVSTPSAERNQVCNVRCGTYQRGPEMSAHSDCQVPMPGAGSLAHPIGTMRPGVRFPEAALDVASLAVLTVATMRIPGACDGRCCITAVRCNFAPPGWETDPMTIAPGSREASFQRQLPGIDLRRPVGTVQGVDVTPAQQMDADPRGQMRADRAPPFARRAPVAAAGTRSMQRRPECAPRFRRCR